MKQMYVTPKLSWRLEELHQATGLRLPFWRKMVQKKKVRVHEVEGAIVIMDEDLKEFLTRKPRNSEAQIQDESLTATV